MVLTSLFDTRPRSGALTASGDHLCGPRRLTKVSPGLGPTRKPNDACSPPQCFGIEPLAAGVGGEG